MTARRCACAVVWCGGEVGGVGGVVVQFVTREPYSSVRNLQYKQLCYTHHDLLYSMC